MQNYPPTPTNGPRPTPQRLTLMQTLRGYWRTYRRQAIPVQIIIGALVIFVSCAFCTAASQNMATGAALSVTPTVSSQQAKHQQSTPTTAPTQPPVPTPKPDVELFNAFNQHDSLPFDKSKSFQAEGNIYLEFSCGKDTKDGVDIQFNLLKMASDGTPDNAAWSQRMSCADLGTDHITVAKGTYRATVASNGDTGWNFRIVQKSS